MSRAVICEPVRSPVGRYGGALAEVPAAELGSQVLTGLLERSGVAPDRIDDIILGQCYPNGEAPAIGRVVALDAGLPVTTTGIQIDRRCGSGLQAILYAAMQVEAGVSDIVVAGGVESMSQAEYYTTAMRWGARGENREFYDRLARGRVTSGGRNHPVPGGMLETAENLRREYSITREAQDRLSLTSHERALAAIETGVFAEEIVPITVSGRKGDVTVSTDEHPRPGLTLDALAALRPVRLAADPESTVTAGNASGQNDGAAMCLVMSEERAAELDLRPLARVVAGAVAGVPPATMGVGPVPAVARVMERAGLTFDDMDLIELNEAFAVQVLACTTEWGFGEAEFDRLNVRGSGISLGHAVGGTGARIAATMLRELDRRQGRFALETLCIGGGQGIAAVFERI